MIKLIGVMRESPNSWELGMSGIQQDASVAPAMDGWNPQCDAARRLQPLVADRAGRFGVWNGIPSHGEGLRSQIGDDLIGYVDRVHDVPRARNIRSEVNSQLEHCEGLGARAIDHPMALAVPTARGTASALSIQDFSRIDLLAEPVNVHGTGPLFGSGEEAVLDLVQQFRHLMPAELGGQELPWWTAPQGKLGLT